MNVANKLTISRILMAPFFVLFLEIGGFYQYIFALIVFFVAMLTDFIDGQIARRNNTITTLGIFLDPLADKIIISAAFICFVDIVELSVPAWLVIVIISREFLISGLRSIAASKNIIIVADKYGKFKTTSQVVVIVFTLALLIANTSFLSKKFPSLFGNFYKIPFWLIVFVSIITIYSGARYIYNNKNVFVEEMQK
ncbi:MAG: CDP-diacylglycerol--glycerol-3-phosphate 3-phosphatidyltransferase [Elusimicrobiota bacterium]|jgi:CDP-diacylglycerol--glycerol-3-phosphate 3-phosphatidyltransferase|nr:CDP-diacylglycerol--glycerol-3-phosphate 3-phosphatidyltransferase [Elusimicrobiota bacterium]